MITRSPTCVKIAILLLAAAIFVGIVTGFILYANFTEKPSTAAIASNGLECAAMGKEVFRKGGTVADAAVTTVLCEGVASPHSSGIGGGFILVMYEKKAGTVRVLNARERAPRNATADMFVENPRLSTRGGKAVAVPGEIKGLWELHQRHGKLKWSELLQPVIELCRNGIEVGSQLARMIASYEGSLRAEPSLREIFINQATNETYKLGEKFKRPKLAETLEVLAREGAAAMYGGEIGRRFVEDVQTQGGVLIEKDLLDYRAEWLPPVSTTIKNNATLFTAPLPSSGSLILLMFNLLRNFQISPNARGYQLMVEAFKFAFAHRTHIGAERNEQVQAIAAKMADKDYADSLSGLLRDDRTNGDAAYYGANAPDVDDKGTSHVSILAPNGDAIAVTNTINDIFGAMFRSPQTGIIPNDEMDDFSTPGGANADGVLPSGNNFVIPGNNPISSMTPSIVLDAAGNVRMVVGGAGGRRIVTGTFTLLYRHFYFDESVEEAMSAPRLHHQLTPMELIYESNFDGEILKFLNETAGHRVRDYGAAIANMVAITASESGDVRAVYDPRRGGSVEVF